MAVELLSYFAFQPVYEVDTVLVEERNKRLENIEMECGCYDFAVRAPFLARADEQTFTQPRSKVPSVINNLLNEILSLSNMMKIKEHILPVFGWFVNVNVTAEDDLNVTWVYKKDNQFWTKKCSCNVSVDIIFENLI